MFFYEVAALVLVLFVMQAVARERDRAALAEEQARAQQLAAALERADHERHPKTLHVVSYLVNTHFVRTLRREASGVGTLTLSDGTEVPVSRRIMPKVRSALS